jgi:HupE / UreJ protein
MRYAIVVVLAIICAALAPRVSAHKPSDAYLTLAREATVVKGQWDIALRDLDGAIGLDTNGDDEITWGEVRGRKKAIAGYALSRLSLSSGGEPCTIETTEPMIDRHTDGAYVVLMLEGSCGQPGPMTIGYRLLFDIDPQHRGLLNYVEHEESRSVIFSADAPRHVVGGDSVSVFHQFTAYAHEGIWHIWLGYDHILFLVSLLLPAVLVRRESEWRPASSFRASFVDVAKVVTAFTIAHSITLSLGALGVVALPSRLVESAIALSVVLAALNNLFPVVAGGRWIAAFAFGLIHGFGFAGALQDLGLPANSLVLSLFGFNVGVELGQLVIVAAFLPLAFALRATWSYRRVVLGGGSVAIMAIAGIWLVERALDLKWLAI